MELTKFTHACVRLDDGNRRLVIDPGAFSELDQALDGVDAVLITHEHADHIDVDKLKAAAQKNSSLRVWAPQSVADDLDAEWVSAVGPGETFDAAGFAVETFGGQHAVIHPLIPTITNNCYLIDGNVYHPGDSFVVPTKPVQTLLVPLHAPWSKTSEVVDFAVSVRAPKAYAVHDGLLNDFGVGFTSAQVENFAGQHGSVFERLAPVSTVSI